MLWVFAVQRRLEMKSILGLAGFKVVYEIETCSSSPEIPSREEICAEILLDHVEQFWALIAAVPLSSPSNSRLYNSEKRTLLTGTSSNDCIMTKISEGVMTVYEIGFRYYLDLPEPPFIESSGLILV